VAVYRKALDGALAARAAEDATEDAIEASVPTAPVTDDDRTRLTEAFSRGFTTAYLEGELGGVVRSESPTMIGGYTGGPETTEIASIATDLLQYPMCGSALPGSPSYDIRYAGNCGRHGVWTQSIATQAITRNSPILQMKTINQVAGPMTEMFFLESIVGMTAASVSGQTFTISPRSAGGSKKNGLTPIETIVDISARLIANQVSYQFKHEAIQTLFQGLQEQVAAKEAAQ